MDYITARQKAVKYLASTKKTEYEVRNKLASLGVEDEIIDKVIIDIEEIGYIDDVAYTSLYIKQCSNEMKKSTYEIRESLLQKGVKEGIIDKEINILYEIDYEKKVIEKIVNSKSKTLDEDKILMYLFNRGFDVDIEGKW
ncbi:MAG: regulatory protein RecX [Clostridia bacterium]